MTAVPCHGFRGTYRGGLYPSRHLGPSRTPPVPRSGSVNMRWSFTRMVAPNARYTSRVVSSTKVHSGPNPESRSSSTRVSSRKAPNGTEQRVGRYLELRVPVETRRR
eukprot:570604-Rhodomonas_salina.2